MAVYRKAPQTFTSGSRITSKRSFSLSPFGGLEINENPLTTTAGSASDSLNMVVDDNSFLTLRPRIIEDADYLNAKQIVTAYCGQNDAFWNNEVTKLKNGYLFLISGNAIRMTITNGINAHDMDGEYAILELSLCGNTATFDFGDEDIVVPPVEVVTHILADLEGRDGYVESITDYWTWSSDGTNYIDFYYNMGQPLPITINNYSLSDGYYEPTGCTATFSTIEVTRLLLFVPSSGTTPEYEIDGEFVHAIGSFDDFIIVPEKDYTRFVSKTTGVHYKFFLDGSAYKFEEAPIYIPTYKSALMDTLNINDAPVYEDLNILSNSYKLTINYNERSNIDLRFFETQATGITHKPYKIETIADGDVDKVFACYSPNGYVYFSQTQYNACINQTSGSLSLDFYYYSFDTKQAGLAFSILIYAASPRPVYATTGMTKVQLAKLYKSSLSTDDNGNTIYKLMYDQVSHSLVRVYPTMVLDGSNYKSTGLEFLYYKIGDGTYGESTITLNGMAGDNAWAVIYSDGKVFGIFNENKPSTFSNTCGLVDYSLINNEITTLIGRLNDAMTYFLPATIPISVGDYYLPPRAIAYCFVANQKTYIISYYNLNYLVKQTTTVNGIYLVDTLGTPFTSSDIHSCLYTDVGGVIDTTMVVDLKARAEYILPNFNYLGIHIAGEQVLLYNNRLNMSGEPIVVLPVRTPTDVTSLSLAALFSANPAFVLLSIMLTPWGVPLLVGREVDKDNVFFVKVDLEASKTKSVLQYYYQQLDDIELPLLNIFCAGTTFHLVDDAYNIKGVKVIDGIIEYTYALTNNDKNPLKLPQDIIDQHTKYATAYRFTSLASGTALINSSQIYYNEHFAFVTEPLNYDYIPVIHCHESIRPIRFATSYAQTLGVIYEQNNIEYISFTDNPFLATEFLAHSQVCLFESVEQRAIDYLPNGYLVTFTGITVYINEGGVYALNFNANTPQDAERKASLISSAVNAKLLKEDISTCILANSDPYVLFMFPKSGYTSVYALKVLTGLWFYWELPITITKVVDDNRQLRLQSADRYVLFTEDAEVVEVADTTQVYEGSVERYLDLDETPIKWYWKSQLLPFGSPTSQKQITDTFFTFVNPNAGITFDTDTFEITQNRITSQPFGLRFYTYRELISESPVVAYDGQLNIINNLRRRTYLNRFKYCQMLCYNIEDEQTPSDKVRIAHISILYKYLTGGK